MKNSLIVVLFSIFFIACTNSKEELAFDKPEIQIPKKSPEPRKNKGSLYSVQGASLFADKKDLQVGDIIQIVISENTKQAANNKRELSSTRDNSLGGGLLAATGTTNLSGAVGSAANDFNSNLGVGFETNSSSADKGSVKTQVAETFSSTVSAIIEETYQNGNYYIKGKKEMLIEGQKQEVIISGVIRPYDITSDNSINSSQIANLKLLYDKNGTEADILETPWGLKLVRTIWPF
jgi:flagellar L-ring protein precursor FlgH